MSQKIQNIAEEYRKQLHAEIDKIFDATNQNESVFTMEEFGNRSFMFLKEYYFKTAKVSEDIFENDPTVDPFIKMKNKVLNEVGGRKMSEVLDKGTLALLEVTNHFMQTGHSDYRVFTELANKALKFLFQAYMVTFAGKLPQFLTDMDDAEKFADNIEINKLKDVFGSFAYDFVKAVRISNIDDADKMPLTMLLVSELQDRAVEDLSKHYATNMLVTEIADKFTKQEQKHLTPDVVERALKEVHQRMTKEGANTREELKYFYILRINTDLYISMLQTILNEEFIKEMCFSEDTKKKISSIKSDLDSVVVAAFDRIK